MRLFLLVLAAASASVSAQGSLLVVGGGRDVPAATEWFVARAPGAAVVVLDYADDPGIGSVGDLEDAGATVTYLPVTSVEVANDSATVAAVRAAGGVYLPGGDQSRYVALWKGTALEDAVRDVFLGGGAVGGSSAGAMVLGGVAFDARRGSISSRRGLLTPSHPALSLTDDFLGLLPGVLFDTHFFERGRLGRLAGLVARYHADAGRWVTGIGIDDGTAVVVDADGVAEVMGAGAVAVLAPGPGTEATVEVGRSLSLSSAPFAQFTDGFRFDPRSGALVSAPADSEPFALAPFAPTSADVWLDGSATSSSWRVSGGVLEAFLEGAPGVVAVISAPGDADAAAVFDAVAASRPDAVWVEVDPAAPPTAALEAVDAVVLVGLEAETAAALGPGTAAGDALRARPSLFLGDAARWAGSAAVTGTERRSDAAFRGLLQTDAGTALVPGTLVIPLAWDTDDRYWENHTAGLAWGLARSGSGVGILVAEGSRVEVRGTTVAAVGPMPAVLVDSRAAARAGYPAGRHNAALVATTLHVLSDGESLDLALPTDRDGPPAERGAPSAYPNPSAAAVTLALDLEAGGAVTAEVVDVLGRRVVARTWPGLEAGAHRVGWAWPDGVPAGTYVVRLRLPGRTEVLRVTRVR